MDPAPSVFTPYGKLALSARPSSPLCTLPCMALLSLTLVSSLGLRLPAKRNSPAPRCTQLAMQQPVYSADLVDENPDYTLISTTLLSQLLDVDQVTLNLTLTLTLTLTLALALTLTLACCSMSIRRHAPRRRCRPT